MMISAGELATIYEQHRRVVLAYLVGTLHVDPSDAEDILHESTVIFWKHYNRLRKPLNLLVQICKHKVFDRAKHDRMRSRSTYSIELEDSDQDLLEDIIRRERIESFRENLLKVSRGRDHTVIRMYLDGERVRDIAEVLGMSPQSVYRTLRRNSGLLVN